MRIKRIHAAECKLPLPQPIRLGPVEITTRDFVVLRLETDCGRFGDALAYPRGSALLEATKRMAPYILGSDVTQRRATVDGFLQNFVNGRPTYVKAASLFDIALWDLAAKAASLPLHQYLGGFRSTVPVMVVAGYYLDHRTIEDVCEEIRLRVGEGYARIKIMILGNNPEFDERLVSAAKDIAENRLCIDAHWAWTNIAQAFETCRRLDQYDLQFIEDPFGPHQGGLSARLQEKINTPLAYGEDLPDLQTISTAIKQVPYYRLDATTCGGVSTAIATTEYAGICGTSVVPHVFLPVHAQLAGALRPIDAVELIPENSGACPMYDLLHGKPNIDNGILTIDDKPGAGFDLNWKIVEKTAATSWTLDAQVNANRP
jgi:L-alanine-DL-glutamate epimerase-like enolase superfamily enzyme